MNNLYFAQYLVNTGAVTPAVAKETINSMMTARPSPPLISLLRGEAGADEKFVQSLMDEGKINFKKTADCLATYRKEAPRTVYDAVMKIAHEDMGEEASRYARFADIFIDAFSRLVDAPALINFYNPAGISPESSYVVSQKLVGDMNLVTGIFAGDEVIMEMARRYSREPIREVNDLALDSVAEFLNVVNGLFIVELGRHDIEVDLEAPRSAKDVRPSGGNQLINCVDTTFGSFMMVMASDEFALPSS